MNPNLPRELVTQDSVEDYHRLMGSLTVVRLQPHHFLCGGRVSFVILVRMLAIMLWRILRVTWREFNEQTICRAEERVKEPT